MGVLRSVSGYLSRRMDRPAADIAQYITAADIEGWAYAVGCLPTPSAHAFGGWLEDAWSSLDGDRELTVSELLKTALEKWTGGRPI
jgi:hypothetical protein